MLTCPQKRKPVRTQPAAPAGVVQVKLFGSRGELLSSQEVSLKEFMSDHFTRECLPEGTTFVMYHEHTAYYQTGASAGAGV